MLCGIANSVFFGSPYLTCTFHHRCHHTTVHMPGHEEALRPKSTSLMELRALLAASYDCCAYSYFQLAAPMISGLNPVFYHCLGVTENILFQFVTLETGNRLCSCVNKRWPKCHYLEHLVLYISVQFNAIDFGRLTTLFEVGVSSP